MTQGKLRLYLAAVVVVLSLMVAVWIWRSSIIVNEQRRQQAAEAGNVENDTAELDETKQKQIWDNEHITFELEKRFGSAFLDAILASDAERIDSFFRDNSSCQTITGGPEQIRQKDQFTETRIDEKTSTARTVSSEDLAKSLASIKRRFSVVEQKKLRVLGISQLSGSPPRWEARILIGFVGLDQNKQPLQYSSEHQIQCTIADEAKLADSASLDDWSMKKEVWRECKQRLFKEITSSTGLTDIRIPDNWQLPVAKRKPYRFQIAVADYNRDGRLDVAVSLRDGTPLLFAAVDDGRFMEVAESKKLKSARRPGCYTAAWIDYDNDGWPDLLLGDRLFRNLEGRQFEDVTTKLALSVELDCMGVVPADYDGDGWLDLYFVYPVEHGTMPQREQWVDDDESGKANQLWRNDGGQKFVNVTTEANASGGNRQTHAATWFFFDEDHRPDLYIANDFGKNVILRNRGDGSFEDVSEATNARDFATSMGVASGDVNNDGRPDLYVANMFSKMGRRIIGQVGDDDYPSGIYEQIKGSCAGNRLYWTEDGGDYRDVSDEMGVNGVGWAYAPVMFDADADGWLDLYATTGFLSVTRDKPDG